ncbi:RNA polymerase sigma factor (sigma-70 family) [Stackebrandtia endophytica]|uniref:RNA polymerase sigma factor n=1 Tax=Stackebrandtia endophytica TaxID=1496996 RepID=A0A543AZ46_9ACTN|nr:sigma-70 family RNA polymerase sigma factor [Stackebrandtia endophytica]TQL77847.1 RNA polymerase sigma factor (sigma-70 family) [Stackebrandtia endophytica]
MSDTQRAVEAVWRIEGARVVAALARMVGDLGQAEDLAQEAVADALAQWPESGIPRNAGAWLTTVAKRKAIDGWRRRGRLDERYRAIAREWEQQTEEPEPFDDDVLRLMFTACHPVLGREAQVALTLRVVGGLTTEELARMFLVPVSTIQQRITRAKKTLAAAKVPFAVPDPNDWADRLDRVLSVVYLIFTEGYAATSGDRWVRVDLANEALRLGRVLAGLTPREPEVHALVALMEFQASRFAARAAADGSPIMLPDQNRARWNRAQITRGNEALARADALHRGRGNYALQAAIAQCHAVAPEFGDTDWDRIVLLYEALGHLTANPVVKLNHAVAVSMASGPAAALPLVDALVTADALPRSYLLPSVRGELLARLGRDEEAVSELTTAAALVGNTRQRGVLLTKVEELRRGSASGGGATGKARGKGGSGVEGG